jgi:hypothetical protein
MSELSEQWDREQAALDACYDAINRMWQFSGVPDLVLQTPDWQEGWRALLDWVGLYNARFYTPKEWESVCADTRPKTTATWAQEVHIFSHQFHRYLGYDGHSPEHVKIEKEGLQTVVAWWRARR